jgi:hypothetical protein
MEDKNNYNDFEQFLRSSIEDFKMIPSRKIWYGIYNSMHPDRKWPSIAVCLIILAAIMYIGVANNNSISNSARRNAEENLLASTIIAEQKQNKFSTSSKPQASFANLNTIKPAVEHIVPSNNNSIQYSNNISNKNNDNQHFSPSTYTTKGNEDNAVGLDEKNAGAAPNNVIANKDIAQEADEAASNIILNEEISNAKQADAKMVINVTGGDINDIDKRFEKNTIAKLNANDTKKPVAKNTTTSILEEKLLTEVNLSKTKPHISKLKENGSMAYYITPSFGFRTITNTKGYTTSTASVNSFAATSITNTAPQNMKDAFALNVEAGAVFQYKLAKNIRLKTGIQANYTNYISKVTELDHPTQAALAVTGQQNNLRASSYATKEGTTNLNKTNWQLALPIGVDIQIAGNNKLKWYIGATAQPTYVFGGSAFVLSSDGNYYISENNLMRKWNLNTAVETFLSFKPSAAVTLNVGPQFRYQVFSSYKKAYNYSEKLYNVGVKVGISTNF